ncbi:class I SAM-dependent DNA methyltransferase [Candidatus Poriferisodalis sp.]|uniref:class I SAM-dependent DNA methyltransferase n=1 Tax=Candidatus Poriferisodalis sp. TaxID=3101277 RepID=UPI003B02C918
MTGQSATDSAATSIGLDDAYAVDGPEDNRKLYASWAETYESVFLAENDYEYHLHVAAAFCGGENLRNGLDGPVLDVGCGTGVVGAELARLGVGVIDGIDISPEMLAKAAAKMHEGRATYRQLFEADLTGRLDLGSDAYAGIVSAGAFTHGHLGPESVIELLRVAQPGARCSLGINSAHFVEVGFGDWLLQRQSSGQISGLDFELHPIYGGADPDDPDRWTRIAVFTVA